MMLKLQTSHLPKFTIGREYNLFSQKKPLLLRIESMSATRLLKELRELEELHNKK
jgi:hypothetical protein